jgi:hypothetical protein
MGPWGGSAIPRGQMKVAKSYRGVQAVIIDGYLQ